MLTIHRRRESQIFHAGGHCGRAGFQLSLVGKPALKTIMEKPTAKPTPRSLFVRVTRLLLLITGIPLMVLAGCQSKLIYFPRPYAPGTTAE